MTRKELETLRIIPLEPSERKAVKQIWDQIAKPLDSLGTLEEMICRIGAIAGTTDIRLKKRAVLVMCADNGIVEAGISQTGQEVTAIVAENMAKGISSVCRMAKLANAEVLPVDIGICGEKKLPGLLDKKVAAGTKNFLTEPAMTEEETLQAIETGMELVRDCKKQGYDILATGEMGIGNTTTSSAVAAALLGHSVEELTGRGAGLSDEGLWRKRQAIILALEKYDLLHADAFTILSTVGGLDIAGLVGVFVGAGVYRIPVILDGVISAVAALLAERMVRGVREYMLASHVGREPAAAALLQELGLTPVIQAELALGEGTGAVMLLPLLDMALSVYQANTTFSDIKVAQYQRFQEGTP